MSQDRESGVRADKYGRETAKKIAEIISATSISKTSNEFLHKNRKITIRCARNKTNDIGVSYKMLDRIDAVIAALEQGNEEYKLYEISPQSFKQNMRETKSKGASAGKVGLVRKIVFMNKGTLISTIKL